MLAKRVAGDAGVVNVSRLAREASLRRKTLLLDCSSARSVPMACHVLFVLSFGGGAGVWAFTDSAAPSTVIPTRTGRLNTDQTRGCTDRAPKGESGSAAGRLRRRASKQRR